jgi:hypothetical protein
MNIYLKFFYTDGTVFLSLILKETHSERRDTSARDLSSITRTAFKHIFIYAVIYSFSTQNDACYRNLDA